MLLSNAYPTNQNRIQQNVWVLPDMKAPNNVSSGTLEGWFQWNKMIFDHILRCILSRSWVNPTRNTRTRINPPLRTGGGSRLRSHECLGNQSARISDISEIGHRWALESTPGLRESSYPTNRDSDSTLASCHRKTLWCVAKERKFYKSPEKRCCRS